MAKQRPMGMRIGESVFCIGYLLFVLIAACIFIQRGDPYASLCAIMTALLGGGDAFHLIPRILINIKGETDDPEENRKRRFWLGLGNLISSITMTIFYVFLYRIMAMAHPVPAVLYQILLILSLIRILLCLLPQNRWFSTGDQKMGIIRNIPFLMIGVITVFYLIFYCHKYLFAILVTVSFLCYMAVVLYAKRKPMLGMMMIPKTICYIWMIATLL